MSRLKDIASYLGVSVSTVSRVVNNLDRVDPETRKMVLTALRDFSYKPDESARILRGKRSNTIGIIVSDISNIFFAKIVRGAESTAMQYGYNILVCNTDSDPEREKQHIQILLSKHVFAIIMAGASLETDIRELIGDRVLPYVYVDNLPRHDKYCLSVSIENIRATRDLTEYLIKKGHKRIAILAGSQRESTGTERLEGWYEAMKMYNLPIDGEMVVTGEFTLESGFSATEKLLANKNITARPAPSRAPGGLGVGAKKTAYNRPVYASPQ
jgi:LacI family transcriptional regulator